MEDSDEGIVLSDLLRTGEASRLRRRGAIRDHRHPHHSPPPPPSQDQDQTTFRLFCRGGETSDSLSGRENASWSNEAFTPDLFWSPTKGKDTHTKGMTIPPTGVACGALVHSSAYSDSSAPPSSPCTAHTEPSTTVVPLDAVYFDDREDYDTLRLGVNGCGCVREGLGCSLCGAALGTIWRPCKPFSTPIYSFFPDAVYACPDPQKSSPHQSLPLPQSHSEPQTARPPPRRRPTRIGEDQVNAALSVLESSASDSAPYSPASPTSTSSSSSEESNTFEDPDPEIAFALAMPWFGFSVSLPEDLESCDITPTQPTRDFALDVVDERDDESIDDVEAYLERRIGGVLFECRGDDSEEETFNEYRYREEFGDYDYDPVFFPAEERRERRLSVVIPDSLQRTRSQSVSSSRSPSSPSAPQMSRSYAQSRFR